VYIDNAAYAQLLAADQLRDNPDQCGGKAYFITQGEPVLLWDFINEILANAGAPIVAKRIPYPMAWLAGLLMESFHHLFRPSVEPLMTRFLAQELSHDHWFDISAARQDLNYSPLVSTKDGLEILQNWILDNPQLFK
jgi:nucleoside-diphosphate-sugar epimerase